MTVRRKTKIAGYSFNSQNKLERKNAVTQAVQWLRSGGVISMPSDTIYGLFAAWQPGKPRGGPNPAILHRLKNRPLPKPFLTVIPQSYPLGRLAELEKLKPENLAWIKEVWPGRNTVIFPKKPGLDYPPGDTIAIRVPAPEDNLFFYETLNELGLPLLAPSLNIHNSPPLEDFNEMKKEFGMFEEIKEIFFDTAFRASRPSSIWSLLNSPPVKIR